MSNNLDRQYTELVSDILKNGKVSGDRTGTGTVKVFGRMIRHDMSEGFPLLTTKKMHWKGILHELLWFLKGDTNIKYLVDNGITIWVGDCYKRYRETLGSEAITQQGFINMIKSDVEFAKEWGELGMVYGKEWIDWYGINQVQDVIDTLKTNPDSRRMLVTAWNPVNVKNALLPPCHYAWQVVTEMMTREERLACEIKMSDEQSKLVVSYCESPADEWLGNTVDSILNELNVPVRKISLMYNMRSVDTGLGMPYDIASYGFLLSMIAQCVNMVPNELISVFADTHIYLNQIDGLKEQVKREPFKLPRLKLNREIKNVFDFKFQDVDIVDYQSQDKVFLPLSN